MAFSRKRSPKLSYEDAIQVWLMIFDGAFNHTIAAEFGVNQGRISEIRTGQKLPGSREAALELIKEEDPMRYEKMIKHHVFSKKPAPGQQYFFPFD